MSLISSGLLIYRRQNNQIEILLAHPGGPFYSKKDLGVWSIPKGLIEEGEDMLETAKREAKEELATEIGGEFIPLGEIKQKGGKIVYAWTTEKDIDVSKVKSNFFEMEWPPKSGKIQKFPENDKTEYFNIETARQKINPAQAEFINRLLSLINK